MKRIFFFLFLTSCGVVTHEESPKKQRLRALTEWVNVAYWGSFDTPPCLEYLAPVNAAFFKYQQGFLANTGGQTIILGDSTMRISGTYSGWLDPSKTFNYAVEGNTSCDINAEMRAISPFVNPTTVLIATTGGNDLAGQRAANAQITQSVKDLIDKVRARWPGAKIDAVGIHPTQVSYANNNKAAVNSAVQSYLAGLSNTCFYNPLPLFGVAEGQAAPVLKMLDSIHYNETVSFQLKAALVTACGLTL